MSHLFHQSWSRWHSFVSLSLSLPSSFHVHSSISLLVHLNNMLSGEIVLLLLLCYTTFDIFFICLMSRCHSSNTSCQCIWCDVVTHRYRFCHCRCTCLSIERMRIRLDSSDGIRTNYHNAHRSFIVHLTCLLIFYWSSFSIATPMTGINRIFFDLFFFVDKWAR